MNFSDLISNYKFFSKDFLGEYCIVNEEFIKLDYIENMDFQEFINFVQKRIPKKLYKYFPNWTDGKSNSNYSIEALTENSVYLSFPKVFDDIYDSDVSISFELFEHLRIAEYCKRAGIHVDESESLEVLAGKLLSRLSRFDNFRFAFDPRKCSEIENLANVLFCERLALGGCNWNSLHGVIKTEYKYCLEELKNSFKTTCFATSPLSQLMWGGAYGNRHRGFCIEYSVSRDEKYRGIYENLFPLVYSKVRSNMEKDFINQIDSFPSIDNLKNIYLHGALRKSIDWAFQNEWRLLLMEGMPEMKDSKVQFFPISKVFIGSRMDLEDRKTIMEIAREKGIEVVGVRKRQDIFEMEECELEMIEQEPEPKTETGSGSGSGNGN